MRLMVVLLPLLVLSFTAAQGKNPDFPSAFSHLPSTMKEVMRDDLENPAAELAIGVTPEQLQLRALRLAEGSTRLAFEVLRQSVKENGDSMRPFADPKFLTTPAGALMPLLSDDQLARLRRHALRSEPSNALATDEIAKAVRLTPAQRNAIESDREKGVAAATDPASPAMKAIADTYATIADDYAHFPDPENKEGITVRKVDAMQAIVAKLHQASEMYVRLSSKVASAEPDPLSRLDADQLRRFHEISDEPAP